MKKPLKVLEPHEVAALLAWTQHYCYSYDTHRTRYRNYLIILLMLDTGIRVGELVQLQISDLWMNEKPLDSLVVRPEIAKGGHERIIPLSTRLAKAISNHIEFVVHHKLDCPLSPIFDVYMATNHLTTRTVQRIVSFAGETALRKKLTPHMLRHTFATRLMRQTNIRVVQELLGHRRLSSTQIYTHPNHADLKKAIDGL